MTLLLSPLSHLSANHMPLPLTLKFHQARLRRVPAAPWLSELFAAILGNACNFTRCAATRFQKHPRSGSLLWFGENTHVVYF